MSSALALLKPLGSSGQDQEDIPVLLLGQSVDGAETEDSEEAASRSSDGWRTQEEPCWEWQAGPCSGGQSPVTVLSTSGWSLTGSGWECPRDSWEL